MEKQLCLGTVLSPLLTRFGLDLLQNHRWGVRFNTDLGVGLNTRHIVPGRSPVLLKYILLITNPDAPSNIHLKPEAVLLSH